MYDAAGRLTEIREPDNAQAFAYDIVDRVVQYTTITPSGQATIGYEYDALDRRTKRTVAYPGGTLETTLYAYDKASRILSITQSGVNGTQVSAYTWDAASHLTQKTLPGGIQQQYTYDDANRLVRIDYKKSDGTLIESIAYGYDANGQRSSKTSGIASVPETVFSATYDAANRMTGITLNPGTGSLKTYALTYDDHGNLTRKENAADPTEFTTYEWDARNRLSRIVLNEATSTSTASFKYDALGRRIERSVTQGSSTQSTQYVYDGVQAIGELQNGVLASTILTGLNIDEVIARTVNLASASQANPIQTKAYLTDALGSVIAIARATDQTPELFYGYSPYGETQVLGSDTDVPNNSIQYTARENDGIVGGTNGGQLYYYRARYYDPVMKRFIAEDPIGLAAGANVYAYVRGNPVFRVDRLGFSDSVGFNKDKCVKDYLADYYSWLPESFIQDFSLLSYVPGSGATSQAWTSTAISLGVKGAVVSLPYVIGNLINISANISATVGWAATGAEGLAAAAGAGSSLIAASTFAASVIAVAGAAIVPFSTAANAMALLHCSCEL